MKGQKTKECFGLQFVRPICVPAIALGKAGIRGYNCGRKDDEYDNTTGFFAFNDAGRIGDVLWRRIRLCDSQ